MGGWWGFVRIVVCVVALVVPRVAQAKQLHHEAAGRALCDAWDGRGRLTEVIRDTAVVQSSHYDAAGVRIVKREGASTTLYLAPDFEVRDGLATTYVKAGHASVARVDEPAFATTFFPDVAPLEAAGAGAPAPDGVITAGDAWLVTASKAGLVALPPPDAAKAKTADVDAMLASAARRMLGADATQTTYVLHDHLGSPSLETNERGEVKARRWHGPYGEVRGATGAWAEARGFTGKERDEATGLADHGARYLDTRLGRWTAPDPLAVRELGGAELDVYGYVDGRVTLAVDPTGLEGERAAADPAEGLDVADLSSRLGVLLDSKRIQAPASVMRQLRGIANDGYFEVSGSGVDRAALRFELDPRILNAVVALGERATDSRPLFLMSVGRFGRHTVTGGPHGYRSDPSSTTVRVMAVDIGSYGGHSINLTGRTRNGAPFRWEDRAHETRLAVHGILRDLPEGFWAIGFPRPIGGSGLDPRRDEFLPVYTMGDVNHAPGNGSERAVTAALLPSGASTVYAALHQNQNGARLGTGYPDAADHLHLAVFAGK